MNSFKKMYQCKLCRAIFGVETRYGDAHIDFKEATSNMVMHECPDGSMGLGEFLGLKSIRPDSNDIPGQMNISEFVGGKNND